MAWRPAYSLQTLKDQLDNAYPGWLFLGFLGDQSHAAVASDHNPNSAGVVCALDIGPGGGLDIHGLADRLAAKPHPDLKYIISNRRIAEWQYNFKWRAYNGSDPHDTHIHVSVGRGDDGQSVQPYDDRNQWNIKGEPMADVNQLNFLGAMVFRGQPFTKADAEKLAGMSMTEAVDAMLRDGRAQKAYDVRDLAIDGTPPGGDKAAQTKLDQIKKIVT